MDYNTGMPEKKRYYAVVKGRRPGIYTRWTGAGGAQEQVTGYAGAKYRGFATQQEAEAFLRTGGTASDQPGLPGVGAASEAPRTPARRHSAPDYAPDLAAGKVVVFTDGASSGNPGPGGYGVVVVTGENRKELSGGFRCTTNNRMELTAVIAALESLAENTPAVVYSDSRYVVDAVQKGWARRWKANGWMRPADSGGKVNRAENSDLWARLLDLLDKHTAEFRWVRGHASHPENERCDRLAVQAAAKKRLPDDPGFHGTC